jgi:glutathione S-transferase
MTAFSADNPVFVTYMVAAAIMVLKLMGQGWMTVYRMLKVGGGWATPEDMRPGLINPNPRPGQLDVDDDVDRSRRMHRNDLENILPFLACGLIFVAAAPSQMLATILMSTFVLARLAHTVAYATAQSHEIRATLYTIGSAVVIVMAVYVLAAVLF